MSDVVRSKLSTYTVVHRLPGGWFAEFNRDADTSDRVRLRYAAMADRVARNGDQEGVIVGVARVSPGRVVNDMPGFIRIQRLYASSFDSGFDAEHSIECERAYRLGFRESVERLAACDPNDEPVGDATIQSGYKLKREALKACDRVAASQARGMRHGCVAIMDLYELPEDARKLIAPRLLADARAWANRPAALPLSSTACPRSEFPPLGGDYIHEWERIPVEPSAK